MYCHSDRKAAPDGAEHTATRGLTGGESGLNQHLPTESIAAGLRRLEEDFPGWHAWMGVPAGLLYCRRPRSSPPVVMRSSTVAGLRQQIEQWEADHK